MSKQYSTREDALSLKVGIHCRACDAPLSPSDDPELCRECMEVVMMLNRDLISPDDEEEFVFDVENNYQTHYETEEED